MAQYKDTDVILRQLDEYYITAIVQQKHDDVPEDHKKHWKGVQSGINYARNTIIEAPTADVALKSEWTSVEDGLPEIDPYGKGRYGGPRSVRVLCACKQRDGRAFVKEGYYEPCGDGSVYWRIPGSIDSVTHWMPLPAPPTEKENLL